MIVKYGRKFASMAEVRRFEQAQSSRCRGCGKMFHVTPEMITTTREACPPEYGVMTDAACRNIIEFCAECADWEPEEPLTSFVI